MLETIVYISAATSDFREDDLDAMLATARRNNGASGITGMLLYAEGAFIQVLEGETEALDTTMERIRRNPLHRHILEIHRAEISERSFSGWAMGCRKGKPAEGEGEFWLSAENLQARISPSAGREVLALLRQFYTSAYRFDAA